jgi:hypothetical protein
MGTPQIPKTQQDALPILTIAQASAGDIQLLGNSITKFWSSAALNMPFSNISTGSIAYSSTLDVRGCTKFALVVKRTFTVDGADVIKPFVIYGDSGGSFPAAADIFTILGSTNPYLSTSSFSINVAGPSPLIVAFTWGDGTSGWVSPGAGTVGVGIAIGTSVRVALTNSVPTSANRTFSVELWGASS